MFAPALRFFRSLGAVALVFLLFPAPASPQLMRPVALRTGPLFFGMSVAASGDTVAIGSPLESRVMLLDRDPAGQGGWSLGMSVSSNDTDSGFGQDVALSGDTLVVGKVAAYSGEPTTELGAAFVLERNQGGANTWGQVKKLIPSDPGDARLFGLSVAVSGDTAAVGVGPIPNDSPSLPGSSSSVYVFERNRGGANQWGEARKLPLPGSMAAPLSVALDGDTLVVGVYQQQAAYVFERDQGGADSWGLARTLTGGSYFGIDVGISGGTLVVGSYGPQAAYLFERDQGTWTETRRLKPTVSTPGFGGAVAIDGDTVVVNARREGTLGILDSAYVFRRNLGGPGLWGEAGRLGSRSDLTSIAVSGNVALLGHPEWNELFYPQVYIFDLSPLLFAGDIPALGPFGLAAMVLLLLVAGWWISARGRPAGITPQGSR